MNPNDPDKLEASLHRALRRLPDRKAPVGLETRILAEISRRAALPWWRKSFAHWPSSVRAAFFGVSALAAALLVAGFFVLGRTSGANQVSGGIATSFAWLAIARDVVAAGRARLGTLIASVPPFWLYGIGGTVALSYAALAGLGAAAYRAFSGRQSPSTPTLS
jgi:hypothetical protein